MWKTYVELFITCVTNNPIPSVIETRIVASIPNTNAIIDFPSECNLSYLSVVEAYDRYYHFH